MLIRGTKISAVDYIHAERIINEELKKEFLAILQKRVDLIVVPTTIIHAPELTVTDIGNTILQTRDALLRNTILFNSIGFPAVTIPIGLTKDNMPIGYKLLVLHLQKEKYCQ